MVISTHDGVPRVVLSFSKEYRRDHIFRRYVNQEVFHITRPSSGLPIGQDSYVIWPMRCRLLIGQSVLRLAAEGKGREQGQSAQGGIVMRTFTLLL